MNTRIEVAQQKRRLILSPFLVAFFGVLGYATAPTPLVFGIGMGVALILAPLVTVLIDWSERGQASASAAVGGIGAAALVLVLRAVLPHDATIMFAICLLGTALSVGMGISAARRIKRRYV